MCMIQNCEEKDIHLFIYYDFLTRKTYLIDKTYRIALSLFTLRFMVALSLFLVLYFGLGVSSILSIILSIVTYTFYSAMFRILFLHRMPVVESKRKKGQNIFLKITKQSTYLQRIKLMILSVVLIVLFYTYMELHASSFMVLYSMCVAILVTAGYIVFNFFIIVAMLYQKYRKQ